MEKRRDEEKRDRDSGGRTSHGSADGSNIVAMVTSKSQASLLLLESVGG